MSGRFRPFPQKIDRVSHLLRERGAMRSPVQLILQFFRSRTNRRLLNGRRVSAWHCSPAFVVLAVLPGGTIHWSHQRRFGITSMDGKSCTAEFPYRDFYLFVPPLYALKNALLITLFGNSFDCPARSGRGGDYCDDDRPPALASGVCSRCGKRLSASSRPLRCTYCVSRLSRWWIASGKLCFFPVLAGWAAFHGFAKRRIRYTC